MNRMPAEPRCKEMQSDGGRSTQTAHTSLNHYPFATPGVIQMNALKIVLIPALLAMFAGVAMANDTPDDAKTAAKNEATSTAAPASKKHHKHKAKAAAAPAATASAAK